MHDRHKSESDEVEVVGAKCVEVRSPKEVLELLTMSSKVYAPLLHACDCPL